MPSLSNISLQFTPSVEVSRPLPRLDLWPWAIPGLVDIVVNYAFLSSPIAYRFNQEKALTLQFTRQTYLFSRKLAQGKRILIRVESVVPVEAGTSNL